MWYMVEFIRTYKQPSRQ